MVASNRSRVPHALYGSLSQIINGRIHKPIQVTFHSQGLDKVINRMFGEDGVYWKKLSGFDIFKKRSKRDANELNEVEVSLDATDLSFVLPTSTVF